VAASATAILNDIDLSTLQQVSARLRQRIQREQ
jgi:hypothetical protein